MNNSINVSTLPVPRKRKRLPSEAASISPDRTRPPAPGRAPRRLHGDFDESGLCLESCDFRLAATAEWSPSLPPGRLQLCLNLAGHSTVRDDRSLMSFGPLCAGFYATGREGALQVQRQAGERHQFILVTFGRDFLRAHLGPCEGGLHPLVESFLQPGVERAGVGEMHPLTAEDERSAMHLVHPPVCQAARPLWYQSKALQLMVDFFFERRGDAELFCDRQNRLARERTDRVISILREHLAEPPSLVAIGREVACSPFHLSRTFSAETGITIPQYLRKIRMERAAELLRGGKHNVTDAALEVGYSSLSHFSQAFCQTMGCCPALYPMQRR